MVAAGYAMASGAMRMASGTNWAVVHELDERIDSIDARTARVKIADLAADLDAIRRIALANGLIPAIVIVQTIAAALAAGERGPMIAERLSLLRDAVRCNHSHADASAVFAAACAIRLAG